MNEKGEISTSSSEVTWKTIVIALECSHNKEIQQFRSFVLTALAGDLMDKDTPKGKLEVITRERLMDMAKEKNDASPGAIFKTLEKYILEQKKKGLAEKKKRKQQQEMEESKLSAESADENDLEEQEAHSVASIDHLKELPPEDEHSVSPEVVQDLEKTAEFNYEPDPSEDAPDRIYLLIGFPANPVETSFLLTTSKEKMINGIVNIVKRPAVIARRISAETFLKQRETMDLYESTDDETSLASLPISRASLVTDDGSLVDEAMKALDFSGGATPEEPPPDEKAAEAPPKAKKKSKKAGTKKGAKGKKGKKGKKEKAPVLTEDMKKKISGAGAIASLSKQSALKNAWQDLTFDEIAIHKAPTFGAFGKTEEGEKKSICDFVKELYNLLSNTAKSWEKFGPWLKQLNMLKIPLRQNTNVEEAMALSRLGFTGQGSWAHEPMFSRYHQFMSQVPEANVSPAVMLYCMVESIAAEQEVGMRPKTPMSQTAKPLTYQKPTLIHYSDQLALRLSNTEISMSEDPTALMRLDSRLLAKIERDIYTEMQLPRILGQGALPLVPQISKEDRAVQRTELLTFTSLSPNDVDRARRLMEFETILKASEEQGGAVYRRSGDFEKKWRIQERRFYEHIPKHLLSQVLNEEVHLEPLFLKRYYAPTDDLLLAIHHRVAQGRQQSNRWDFDETINHRPTFQAWREMTLDPNFTPRTKTAFQGCMDMPHAMLRAVSQSVTTLFPADRSLVKLWQHEGSGKRWVSVYQNKHIFGLRPILPEDFLGLCDLPPEPKVPEPVEPPPKTARKPKTGRRGSQTSLKSNRGKMGKQKSTEIEEEPPKPPSRRPDLSKVPQPKFEGSRFSAAFVCAFSDHSRCMVLDGPDANGKPDGYGTVTMTHTMTNGLNVSVCSDGSVHMEYFAVCRGGLPAQAFEEYSRTVMGKGMVVRRLRNGSQQTLLASGEVLHKMMSLDGKVSYKFVAQGGALFKWNDEEEKWEENGKLDTTVQQDAETGATMVHRSDGALILKFLDGYVYTRHADGTEIRTSSDNSKVLVECEGYASVEVDVDVDLTCRRHSQGFKVAIKKGGDRSRARIALPNETAMLITYDTRITSTVCGRVISRASDNTEIVAADSGEVELRPRGVWERYKEVEMRQKNDASSDPDLESGVYFFNCVEGNMYTDDSEHNIFDVNLETNSNFKDDASATSLSKPYEINLAGVAPGVDVEAVVNNPIQPRLFIIRRSGDATEILRNEDIDDFTQHLHLKSENALVLPPHPMLGDSEDLGALHHTSLIKYSIPKEPLFKKVFSKYETGLGNYKTDPVEWTTRPLPTNARVRDRDLPLPRPWTTGPEVIVQRTFTEHLPLSSEGRKDLVNAIAEWEEWVKARAKEIDRFAVEDNRDESAIEAERAIQRKLKHAIRAAKLARKREKEKLAAKKKLEQQMSTIKEDNIAAAEATRENSLDMSMASEEEDEEDYDFSDSEPEQEEEDITVVECREAFKDFANGRALLPFDDLRAALVQVMGRALPVEELASAMDNHPSMGMNRKMKAGVDIMHDLYISMTEPDSRPSRAVTPASHARDFMDTLSSYNSLASATNDDYLQLEDFKSKEGGNRPSSGDMKHGAFWETEAGQELRTKIPDQPTGAPPKKKGDVVSLVGQDIPRSHLTTPASTVGRPHSQDVSRPQTRQSDLGGSQDLRGGVMHESIHEEEAFPGHKTRGFDNGDELSLGVNSTADGFGAQAKDDFGVHKNFHKLDTADLSKLSTVGGRHAHRAMMAVKRDTNERLRTGERPRDVDILGNPRKTPVRIQKGKRGELVQEGSLDKAQLSLSTLSTISTWGASHKQQPSPGEDLQAQAKITTKKGGGRNVRSAAIHTFEVLPHLIDMGSMQLGRKYKKQLIITNISEGPARFRVSAASGGAQSDAQSINTATSSQIQYRESAGIPKKSLENKVRPVSRPKQPIAAGMKVPLDIEITAGVLGGFGAAIEIISEYEVITVEIIGQVIDTKNTEPP